MYFVNSIQESDHVMERNHPMVQQDPAAAADPGIADSSSDSAQWFSLVAGVGVAVAAAILIPILFIVTALMIVLAIWLFVILVGICGIILGFFLTVIGYALFFLSSIGIGSLSFFDDPELVVIPSDVLDWIGALFLDFLDYVVRDWILQIAYFVTIQFEGDALSFHTFEHKSYFFTTITPLIMIFLAILWWPLLLTMPLLLALMMVDYFQTMDLEIDHTKIEVSEDGTIIQPEQMLTSFGGFVEQCYTDPFKQPDNLWEAIWPYSELQPQAGEIVTHVRCVKENQETLNLKNQSANDCKQSAVNEQCDYFLYDNNKCRCCDYVELVTGQNSKPQSLYESKHIKMVGKSPYGKFLAKCYELFMIIWWDYEFMLNTTYLQLSYDRIWVVFSILFFTPFANVFLLPIWGAIASMLGLITAIDASIRERDLEISTFEAFMNKGDSWLLDRTTQEYKQTSQCDPQFQCFKSKGQYYDEEMKVCKQCAAFQIHDGQKCKSFRPDKEKILDLFANPPNWQDYNVSSIETMALKLYWESTELGGGSIAGKQLVVISEIVNYPLKINITSFNKYIIKSSYGFYAVKRIHTSPLIKNQFTDIWLMSTSSKDVKVLKKLHKSQNMPKYFLNCVKYCEMDRDVIENDWPFFQDDDEFETDDDFGSSIIDDEYDLPGGEENKLDPMEISQFINGIGRIVTYKMDSAEGTGTIEQISEVYEGQIVNGAPKGFGRRYFFNQENVASAFLGCFKSADKTIDATPGLYFENHFLKYYGLWDTGIYSKTEPDEVYPVDSIDCDEGKS